MTRYVSIVAGCLVAASAILAWPVGASAQTTWLSATTGGTWGVAGNWSGGVPSSSGTGVLGDATANRTVVNATSNTTVKSLAITQTTAGVLNGFQSGVGDFFVTDAFTLGASSGTAQFLVLPTGSANSAGRFTNGITINAGGVLALGAHNPTSTTNYTPSLNGNITVAGGLMEIGRKTGAGTATHYDQTLTNSLFTMTSGSLRLLPFARTLSLQNANVTGGSVAVDSTTNATGGRIVFTGTSETFSPSTYTNPNTPNVGWFELQNNGDVTATFGQGWNNVLNLRGGGVKTVSVNSAATAFNNLRIRDEITGSGTLTLRLGSNLAFAALEVVTSGSATGGTAANFAFDTNGNTLSFASVFAPTVSNTDTATNVYNLLGSGTVVAQRFTLNSGSTAVNVGAGLTLTATSAGVNTLSGSGTIDPTSTFRHAASGSSSFVSTRAVGNIEVASGTLGITTLSAGGQAARATGGTLDLSASGYTFASALVNGGVITNGTFTTAGLLDMRSGTVSAILAGAGNLAKTTAGTLTLSASNAYAGGTTIDGGTLRLGNANALGASSGALAVNGGTLDLGGFSAGVGALSGSSGATITTANTAGTVTLTTNAASSSTFAGTIADNGSGLVALTKAGSGTLTLTGNNTFTGATTVNAGSLLVNGQLGNTAVTVNAGGTLGGSGTIGGAVTIAGGLLSPGTSPGQLSLASLLLQPSSTVLMEITGTTAVTQYDRISLTGGLTYDGTLQLDLSGTFADNTTFNLFSGFTSASGNLAGISSVGSFYNGLSFTRTDNLWKSTAATNGQTLEFNQTTGNLVIVPEPAAIALAGVGIAAAALARRRRGRCGPG